MPLFRLATEILHSSLPLCELLPAEGTPTLFFEQNQESVPPTVSTSWIRSIELDDGQVWVAIGRTEKGILFRFPRYCDFVFHPATDRITCYPNCETNFDTIRHLLLDHVFPLILNSRGFTVLHASAVAAPAGDAMVFLGKSGAGKSTFAASLCAEGFSLIADDCLTVTTESGQLRAGPLYPSLRLWDSSTEQLAWDTAAFANVAQYTDKKRVAVADIGLPYASTSAPISAIFLFNPDGEQATKIALRDLPLNESVIRLVESSYCLDPENKQRNELDFFHLSKLAQNVPVIQVDFPYDFSQFAQLREAVLTAPARQ